MLQQLQIADPFRDQFHLIYLIPPNTLANEQYDSCL